MSFFSSIEFLHTFTFSRVLYVNIIVPLTVHLFLDFEYLAAHLVVHLVVM